MRERLDLIDKEYVLSIRKQCEILSVHRSGLFYKPQGEKTYNLLENGRASVLVGNHIDCIREKYNIAILMEKKPVRPELWDGKTAERCLEAILNWSGPKL